MTYKMYCIYSKEAVDAMGGNRGKLASMAGHAYLHAWWNSSTNYPEAAIGYKNGGPAFKITLVVPTTDELLPILTKYKDICGVSLVTDAARTVFNEPTTVCLGLGPIRVDDIGDDLKSLKVFI